MNPTSQHHSVQHQAFVAPGAFVAPQPEPAGPSPSVSLAAHQRIQRQLHQQLWLPHPGVSGGSIISKHISWVTALRARKGRWLSEVQQAAWTQTENDYYEFTYELFQSGFLKGVEVGLPVRYFISELLGCSVQRIDLKLIEDKRVPDLRCPRMPQRELVECERQGLIKKLNRLERAFLMRERGSLHDRVRYNAPEDASRFLPLAFANINSGFFHPTDQARPSGTTSAPPPTCSMPITSATTPTLATPAAASSSLSSAGAALGAAYASQMMPISTARHASTPNDAPSPAILSTQAAQKLGAVEQQRLKQNGGFPAGYSSSATGVASTGASPIITSAGTTCGRDAYATTGAGSRGALQISPAGSIATASVISSNQTSRSTLTPPSSTSFFDSNGRLQAHTPGAVLETGQGQKAAAAVTAPGPAAPPHASYSAAALQGEALGRKLLGLPRKGSPGEEPPSAKRRLSTGSFRQDPRSIASGTVDANGGDMLMGSVPESAEDEAAMEYLKWELHGKFMAFPGEHYQNLLSCLASEIYHNRYPVEHGVDVLHAVMREAGPGAVQKCAKTLKRMNLPTKMTL